MFRPPIRSRYLLKKVDPLQNRTNTFIKNTIEIIEMWVDLTDAEAASVVAAMREGSVVEKLCARPVLGAGAFLEAAKRNADQDISVDESGIVKGVRWVPT